MSIVIARFRGKYDFLSNFYFCLVEFEGEIYATAEHAFQAAKTLDPYERKWIAVRRTPGQAKRLGRSLRLRPDWEEVKIDVMEVILRSKFKHPELRQKLISTGLITLIEGNDWGDRFWGACSSYDFKSPSWTIGEQEYLYGGNELGILLMKLREEFQREEEVLV